MPMLTVRAGDDVRLVPFTPGSSLRQVLDDAGVPVRWGCLGNGACGMCLVVVEGGDAGEPTQAETLNLSAEQLAHGVRLACQLAPPHDITIRIPETSGQGRGLPLEEAAGVAVSTAGTSGASTVGAAAAEPSAARRPRRLGLAVDLGTTHIRVALCDLATGDALRTLRAPNPQGRFGADIMTRLIAASASEDAAREIAVAAWTAVGEAAREMCALEGAAPDAIERVAVVGNTAMLSLLGGRDPDALLKPASWTRFVDCALTDANECAALLGLAPGAVVANVEPLAGFVGSDLLAAVLATDLTASAEPALLIDFGTNSEIALWDGKRLHATSAAGGPAFEGAGLRCGMPAEGGAIDRVVLNDGALAYEVIGGGEPRGLCGSGLVDAIACLLDTGALSASGKLKPEHAGDGYLLAPGGPPVRLGNADVDTFQRAKAAIGVGIEAVLDSAGIATADLARVCVCGAFGRRLDVGNAIRVGLLPPVPETRVELHDEAALDGCRRLLVSPADTARLGELRDRGVIINLSQREDFEDRFLENLYLRPLEDRQAMHRTPQERELFEAFLKSVQFVVGLKTQQDIRDCLGKLVTTYLPADWVAFVDVDSMGTYYVHHSTLAEPLTTDVVLTPEVRALIDDVLDSGFLATGVVSVPGPSMTVVLPVSESSRPTGVMLVGHPSAETLPKELLNIYLAVAGLAGATFERLNGELELSRYRAHLEDLVKERTLELRGTNERLQDEIAEREAFEAALHAERERLAITLRSIGDGVIATDTEARVVLLNSVAEHLTGWSLEDATGHPIAEVFDVISEDTLEPVEVPVRRALETGTVVELANHTALIARDGTKRSVADSCAPIVAVDGSIAGAVLVFRDVTEQHRAELLRDALNRINTAVGSSLEADEILEKAIVEGAAALGCDRAFVQMRQDGFWEITNTSPGAEPLKGTEFRFDETRFIHHEAEAVEPVVLTGTELAELLPPTLLAETPIDSLVFMPICVKRETFGAVVFTDLAVDEPFITTQLDFVRKLSSALALALENARLYAAERHIAETLQEALISMPQAVPGIEFGHHYHSATKAARVGGDFYDVFQIDSDHVGILMGDVAGKGVSAAAVTLLVQNTLKTLAHQGHSPREVIAKANEIVARETQSGVFVTVFFCILDTATGVLTYCNAGHPPGLLRRSDGRTEALVTGSPIIGAFGGLEYEEASTPLEPGETLVLYTDGVIEARASDGDFFGEERLVFTLAEHRPAPETTKHLVETIFEFTSGELNDDVAILAVSRVVVPPA